MTMTGKDRRRKISGPPMTEFIQVFTTVDSKKKAKDIAKTLLAKRLASCVQVFPINSIYWWRGKIEQAKEWFCLIKAGRKITA